MGKKEQYNIFKQYLDQICKNLNPEKPTIKQIFNRKLTKKTIEEIFEIIMNTIHKLSISKMDTILHGELLKMAKCNVYKCPLNKTKSKTLELLSTTSFFKVYADKLGISDEIASPLTCRTIDYLTTEIIDVFITMLSNKEPLTIPELKAKDPEIGKWIDIVTNK